MTERTLEDYRMVSSHVYYDKLGERTQYLWACLDYIKEWDHAAMNRAWYMPLMYWRFCRVPKIELWPPLLVLGEQPLALWQQKWWSPDRVWACSADNCYYASYAIHIWNDVPYTCDYSDRITIN